MADFRELLEEERTVCFDGAMGTEIYRRGVFLNRCYDALSLERPDLIRAIHADYRDAGADVLETNSFGANRFRLRNYGLEGRVEEINRAAARLAREVAGDRKLVAGSIGPLGVRLEPFGPTSRAEATAAFREQADVLAAGGVDLFVLETFSDLDEIRQAVKACRRTGLPVVALMTIQPDGKTSYGAGPERVAGELGEAGADAVGLNCSVGPAVMLEAIPRMAAVTELPLAAVPNAGLPREVEGRKMYMASPEYMATYARKLVQAGVRIVGGCCGTGPEHIREMLRQIRAAERESRAVGTAGGPEVAAGVRSGENGGVGGREPVPLAERSAWGRKLAAGEAVTAVEISPPRGTEADELVEAARRLREAGVDAVSLPDGARTMLRMGAIAAAALVQERAGIEAMPGYSCRDRNLLGMSSDLLGAQALGIRNLLLVTGDPPKTGPYPDATAVFDIDSIGLTNLVRRLNRGQDPGGNPLPGRTSFVPGVVVSATPVDRDRELRRWYWKVDAGAEFAVTTPLFDLDALDGFLEHIEKEGTRIPVVAALWPLRDLREAEYLDNEVPGIRIPDRILERLREAEAGGAASAAEEGVAVARELLREVADRVEGVLVRAPEGDPGTALRVLEGG